MRRLALLVLFAATGLAAPAVASFPGRDGDLVISLDDGSCELGANLYRVTPRGASTQLTDVCRGDDDEAALHYAGAPEAAPGGASLLFFTDGAPGGVASLALADGAVTPVAAAPQAGYDPSGFSATLSFFPDGASFAAGRARHFLDGTAAQPLPVSGGHVSPDGRLLAALRGGRHPGLWLYRLSDGRALRKVGPARAVDVDWSPDGRRLVYATRYVQREVKGGASGGNLFVVRRDGTHRRTLVHRSDIAETQPTWAPDGRTVAWVSLGFSAGDVGFRVFPSLWKVSLRTRRRTRIATLPRPFVEEGYFHAPELTWLPIP